MCIFPHFPSCFSFHPWPMSIWHGTVMVQGPLGDHCSEPGDKKGPQKHGVILRKGLAQPGHSPSDHWWADSMGGIHAPQPQEAPFQCPCFDFRHRYKAVKSQGHKFRLHLHSPVSCLSWPCTRPKPDLPKLMTPPYFDFPSAWTPQSSPVPSVSLQFLSLQLNSYNVTLGAFVRTSPLVWSELSISLYTGLVWDDVHSIIKKGCFSGW